MDNHFIIAGVVFLKQVEKDPCKCSLVIKTWIEHQNIDFFQGTRSQKWTTNYIQSSSFQVIEISSGE